MSEVYFIEAEGLDLVKIGYTSMKCSARKGKIASDCPVAVRILATEPGGIERESELHRQFTDERRHREWFEKSPRLAAYIKTIMPPVVKPSPICVREASMKHGKRIIDLAAEANISVGYLSDILNGNRSPSRDMAYQIYDATGRKYGHLSGLTARDIETARRLDGKAAA